MGKKITKYRGKKAKKKGTKRQKKTMQDPVFLQDHGHPTTLERHWSQLSYRWKHLNEKLPSTKENISYIKKAIENTNLNECDRIVDWGPGGGFLSNVIYDKFSSSRVDFVDIVDDSFDLIRENCSHFNKIYCHKFEDSSGLNIPKHPDLLIGYSVLYHMPTCDYVKGVVNYWTQELSPNRIFIRNMLTDGKSLQKGADEYFVGNNFLRGNIFNREEFISLFKDYYDIESTYGKHANETHCKEAYIECLCFVKRVK